MTKILELLSHFIYKNKSIISSIWFISLIVFIYILSSQNNIIESKVDGVPNTDAAYVEKLLKDDFNINQEASFALLVEGKKNIDSLKKELLARYLSIDRFNTIDDGRKHDYSLYHVRFKADFSPREAQILIGEIRKTTKDWESKNNTKVYITGDSAFFYDTNTGGENDSKRNERIALLISFFILIYTFGGILTAFLPLIIGATTLIYLNGFISIFGLENNTLSQTLNSLIGLGLAIDYSLFIISRFREEKDKNDLQQALTKTLTSAGKTIFFSSLIMLISISVLLIPDVSSSRTVVKSILSVVLVSSFASLFYLPAFLAFSNRFLDKPKFLTNLIKKYDRYHFWRKYAFHIVNHPKRYFLLSISILIFLAYPLLNIKILEPMQSMAPANSESRIAYNILKNDGWGGELVPVIIAV
ncbi:MAG: MMPL family transporter [Candidatus Sericytochromatia bacterium]